MNTLIVVLFNLPTAYFIISHFGLTGLLLLSTRRDVSGIILAAACGMLAIYGVGLMTHYLMYADFSMPYIITGLSSVVIGAAIASNVDEFPAKSLFYSAAVLIFSFVLLFTELGSTDYLNRTYYTVPMVLIWLVYGIKEYQANGRISLAPVIVFLFIAVLTFSRSSMAVAGLMVITYMIVHFRVRYVLYGAVFILAVMISFDAAALNLDVLAAPIERFMERGLDSGRYEFWNWYVSNVDARVLTTGEDQFVIWDYLETLFQDNGRHTLHNSYMQLHAITGMWGIFLMSVWLWIWTVFVSREPLKGGLIMLVLVFLAFFNKSFFDTTIFIQRYDYLFFAYFFVLIASLNRRVDGAHRDRLQQSK